MGSKFQKKRKRLAIKSKRRQQNGVLKSDNWTDQLFPEQEWDAFCNALRTDLPVSFRIQGCHKDRDRLIHEMETKFFIPLSQSECSDVYEPKPLPWYQGAYQTRMTRTEVRSHPILAHFHNFLVTEAGLGHISRQEAVSMIPPLLLNPKADHIVLDMCAAPGSKTAQLVEMMHENTNSPNGMLVANDIDKKRCYMLIHQTLKRFHTANCVVICEDAARMPTLKGKDDVHLKFDRILCDVICSGDGTLRKNPEIWLKWTPQDGLGLHRMQLSIARRGAELLKVGGHMVYSTCSMNPIEDEAVVAQLIRESKGALRLCDTHPLLPKLVGLRGVSVWKVFDRDMNFYEKPSDVPEPLRKMICESCFAPSEVEKASLHLEYCMRIVPHHQDTGGFFVALIEKTADNSFISAVTVSGPAFRKHRMFKDEPFTFLKKDDERWLDIKNHYGIREDFEYENLFSRRLAENDVNCRQLFYANNAVKDFVACAFFFLVGYLTGNVFGISGFQHRNMTTVSIQNAGMKMFSRNEHKAEKTRFRLSQEGIKHLLPFLEKQLVEIDKDDMLKILKTDETMIPLESLRCKDAIREQNAGSLVLYSDRSNPVCTWVGLHTVSPYLCKEERIHMLRMMGVDCSEIEQMMRSKRKHKAAAERLDALQDTEAKKIVIQEVGAPINTNGTTVTSISCGEKHTLILDEDGKMWSVGGNENGQLGRGGRGPGSFTIYPVCFSGGVQIIQVAAGRSHSLAVAEDGRLFAWGSNEYGQLAMPREIPWQETPKRVGQLAEVVQVACGPLHCIALLEEHVFHLFRCYMKLIGILAGGGVAVWGEQADGAILHTPQIVTQLIGIPIVRVAAGGRHCVVVSAGGGIYSWGHNEYGQLGTGDTSPRSTPFFLEGMGSMHIIEAYCGDSHTLLLSEEGRLFAFGSDAQGQIGGGKQLDKHTNPSAIVELMGSTVTRVACGRNHSLVVIGGRLYPFGQNANGQLGNGLAVNQTVPRQTEELDHVVAVFAGFDQSFIIRAVGAPCEQRFLNERNNFGVNLDDVMETFGALEESSDARQYGELIIECCHMSVFRDDFNPVIVTSIEPLHVYLILVWVHVFVTNVTRDVVTRLHQPFAESITRLRPALRNSLVLVSRKKEKVLEKWWINLPVRHFNRFTKAMLSAVRCLVRDKVDPSKCRKFLDILASLCAINKVVEDKGSQVTCWSNYPFLMNAAAKGELLYVEAIISMQTSINGARLNLFGFNLFIEQPFFELTVRRQHIVQDTINGLLNSDRRYLQRPLKVQFMGEDAEDAGGVQKEFFMILFQKLLQSEYGMFIEDPDSHLVWFSGYDVQEVHYYKMVGILCGLAVYNSVLVAFPFPLAVYKDVFCLNFTISYAAFGSTETMELKPDGANISVTQSNKSNYVERYVHHRLCIGRSGEVERQAAAFRDGFKMVLNSRIIAFFQPRELMELVVGNENYDWSELRKIVHYKGEYHANHPAILAFWEAFFELGVDERKQFLQFLMGSTRLPVGGMSALKMYVQPTAPEVLPVAHTCFNLLDLPNISDSKEMLRRLRISIQHTQGFTLA
uniref:tRNA (cytosine(34)-C(5))-methyltransferase n=1 Tax=Angiostrongylus cantonensis TaxID=6313 RepID=A0A158P5R9_ANGCA